MKRIHSFLLEWRYYSLEREDYQKSMKKEFPNNLYSLSFVSSWFAVFALVFFVLSNELHDSVLFITLAVFATLFSTYADRKREQHKAGNNVSNPLIYTMIIFVYIVIVSTGIYISLFIAPQQIAVVFVVLLTSIPMLIFASPIFSLLLIICSVIAFIVLNYLLLPYGAQQLNMGFLPPTVPIAISFTWFVNMYRIRSSSSELKVMEASSQKSKFLSTISHELRTPLNAIIGVSNIELEQSTHTSNVVESFEIIRNSGTTLLGIVNDILDLSKAETGKLDLMPVEYDITSLISDTARLNLMRVGEKPLEFTVKANENLPKTLIGDDLRIKQVLNNFLSNAIKYTEKGSVTFEAHTEKSEDLSNDSVMLVFTIRDTGQGMTPEQLSALYDEYSMFNQEANRETEGTGLGMSITKNLVDMMNGKIEAQSEVGVGSVFKICLQQRLADEAVIGKEAAENLQNFKSSNTQRQIIERSYMTYGKVLIVDDVDANLFVAKGLMKPYGLNIETATSGFEAIEKISGKTQASEFYDIVFLDHMMPGMDGVETLQKIRQSGYTHPIIALTANAVVGQKEIFIESGFDDFISKPIDTKLLDTHLNMYIRDKQSPETLALARQQKLQSELPVLETIDGDTEPTITALKNIPELDVDSAIAAMGSMTDMYIGTTKLTLRLLPKTLEKMSGFVKTDIRAFTVEVHGLKSVLRNIGANTLGNNAEALENAGIKDDAAYCNEHYSAFETDLAEFITKLSAAFPEKAKQASGEHSEQRILFQSLIDEAVYALDEFDCDEAIIRLKKMEEILHEII